jgi:hypothetical protein
VSPRSLRWAILLTFIDRLLGRFIEDEPAAKKCEAENDQRRRLKCSSSRPPKKHSSPIGRSEHEENSTSPH